MVLSASGLASWKLLFSNSSWSGMFAILPSEQVEALALPMQKSVEASRGACEARGRTVEHQLSFDVESFETSNRFEWWQADWALRKYNILNLYIAVQIRSSAMPSGLQCVESSCLPICVSNSRAPPLTQCELIHTASSPTRRLQSCCELPADREGAPASFPVCLEVPVGPQCPL